jgi:phage gp46-like protein
VSDIALTWNQQTGHADFGIASNDYVPEDGLRTAVIASLFCEAPAKAGDVLPDGKIARGGEGGWWADSVPAVPGDAFGCRLWLLRRAKRTPDLPGRAQGYAFEGLQWLLTDKVARAVDVTAAYNAKGWLVLTVTPTRPDGSRVTFKFDPLWVAEESR